MVRLSTQIPRNVLIAGLATLISAFMSGDSSGRILIGVLRLDITCTCDVEHCHE